MGGYLWVHRLAVSSVMILGVLGLTAACGTQIAGYNSQAVAKAQAAVIFNVRLPTWLPPHVAMSPHVMVDRPPIANARSRTMVSFFFGPQSGAGPSFQLDESALHNTLTGGPNVRSTFISGFPAQVAAGDNGPGLFVVAVNVYARGVSYSIAGTGMNLATAEHIMASLLP